MERPLSQRGTPLACWLETKNLRSSSRSPCVLPCRMIPRHLFRRILDVWRCFHRLVLAWQHTQPVEVGIGSHAGIFLNIFPRAITTGVVMSGIYSSVHVFLMQEKRRAASGKVTGNSTVVAGESSASSASTYRPGKSYFSQPPVGQDHPTTIPTGENYQICLYSVRKSTVPMVARPSDMNNTNSQSVSTSDMYPSPEATARRSRRYLPLNSIPLRCRAGSTTQSTIRPAIQIFPVERPTPPEQSTPLWSL